MTSTLHDLMVTRWSVTPLRFLLYAVAALAAGAAFALALGAALGLLFPS